MAVSKTRLPTRTRKCSPVFHIQNEEQDASILSRAIIRHARRSGQLVLSGRGLAHVPSKVWTIDSLDEKETKGLQVKLDEDPEPDEKWWQMEPLRSLDLSRNCLSVLAEDVGQLIALEELNLEKNNLNGLPSALANLKLRKLNVKENKIANLPEGAYDLGYLEWLDMSHNNLTELPDELGNLVMLNHLNLSHNQLNILPPGVGYLTRLNYLDASNNLITNIPEEIGFIRALSELDLSNNKLDFLPPFRGLRRLSVLKLGHNHLVELPDVDDCDMLVELHLNHNNLEVLEVDKLNNMIYLKTLVLQNNKLHTIPSEISNLQQLVHLDLSNNDLTAIPNSMGQMTHLQSLKFEGNVIKSIRRDIIACGTSRILKHLRQSVPLENESSKEQTPPVYLAPKNNVSYPDRYIMKANRIVNLTQQELISVPDIVFQEANEAGVTLIDLSHNRLAKVPSGIEFVIGKLSGINLSFNQITSLPEFMGHSRNLQYIDLQNNRLDHLPNSIGDLIQLKELNLSNNRFEIIPDLLCRLQALEILQLRGNKIQEINVDVLSQCKYLTNLDLADNDIQYVPPRLGLLKLRLLELTGNPFRQPRATILLKGTEHILSYLRDKIPV